MRIASQHGSVSDVLQISEKTLSVKFFQTGSIADSIKEEILSELECAVTPSTAEVDSVIPQKANKAFEPGTPAFDVEMVIAERIRPGVNSDGGDVELVELTEDGVAIVRLKGACNGCPSSDATLKHAIEKTLLHFCGNLVKSVRQEEPVSEPAASILGEAYVTSNDLPSVITHNHSGSQLGRPLTVADFPIVSLFARKVDEKMVSKVRYASHVHIPEGAKSSIDVWVKCVDCGAKKRLEDVNQLLNDAKEQAPSTKSVGVVICPACVVIVTEKPQEH